MTEVKQEPLIAREKSISLLTKKTDKLNVYKRVLLMAKEVYENIKFENLNTFPDLTDTENLKLKVKYKIIEPNETDRYLVRHIFFNANQIHLNQGDVKFDQQTDHLVLDKPVPSKLSVQNQKPNSAAKKRVLSNALQLNEKVDSLQVENDISLKREKSQIIEVSNHNESERPKSRAFSNAFQIMETVENNEAKEEPSLTRDKSQIFLKKKSSKFITFFYIILCKITQFNANMYFANF
ncbi:hypothetical protein BpHYR1_030135 [Brachionus plicatilis]|uniref:Uncharacterized protein n=1 Tax=Brachionus plicatilis TaxID=10195 RepID=A0A3M7RLX3_BRAPC|nr:hypothetical protein BpHYR1_030135 [Brachionus plicatilis]